jgi:thiol-disulfide isomerase/thioredoxin
MPKKKKNETSLLVGMFYGLGGAAIIVVVVLVLIFAGPFGKDDAGSDLDLADGSGPGGSVPDQQLDPSKIRITVVTSENCEKCFDMNILLDAFLQNNVEETGREIVYIEDAQIQPILEKYNITKVPTILVAGELDKDPNLQGFWDGLGRIVDDVFVLDEILPPYISVETGELKGLVSGTLITDESCAECYDVTLHKTALLNLGVNLETEKTIDVSSDEGKSLIKKYKITKVPTILIYGETEEYRTLNDIWNQYGMVADDGTLVFTGMEVMGSYYDLEADELVEIALPDPGAQAVPQQ